MKLRRKQPKIVIAHKIRTKASGKLKGSREVGNLLDLFEKRLKLISKLDPSYNLFKRKIYLMVIPFILLATVFEYYYEINTSVYNSFSIYTVLLMLVWINAIVLLIIKKYPLWLEVLHLFFGCTHVLGKFVYVNFFIDLEGVNIILHITTFTFWTTPIIILFFLIFESKQAKKLALSFVFLIPMINIPTILSLYDSIHITNFGVQFFTSNITIIILLFSLQYLRDSYITVQTKANMMKKFAYQDHLTGLSNRRVIFDFLHAKFNDLKERYKPFAIILMDLDGFKEVNDLYGHDVGDMVLQEVARRLREIVKEEGIIARLGGDEYIVIIDDIKEKKRVLELAESILHSLANVYDLADKEISISSSLGISFYSKENILEEGSNFERIMKQADIALYQAKANGKSQYLVYNHEKV